MTVVPVTERKFLPVLFDRVADREIPDRAVCAYDLHGIRPELRRALTDDERAALERRVAELRPAVAPARAEDREKLLDALLGVQAQGFDDETSMGLAASYLETLGSMPPWAVREACLMVRSGAVKLEMGQTVEQLLNMTARKLVEPYQRALIKARGLLDAPVPEPTLERPPLREYAPTGLHRITAWRKAPPPNIPPGRLERLRADLEARKARNEALRTDPPAGGQP